MGLILQLHSNRRSNAIGYLLVQKIERDSYLKRETPELMKTRAKIDYPISVCAHKIDDLRTHVTDTQYTQKSESHTHFSRAKLGQLSRANMERLVIDRCNNGRPDLQSNLIDLHQLHENMTCVNKK